MSYCIDILLPTYNGAKYLSAQVDSLICQSYKDWRLIIRDDLSSDATQSVICNIKDAHPEQIHVLDNASLKKGIVGSFDILLRSSSASYVAFCDQDDVWEPDKLQIQIKKMRELEQCHGEATPILLHTDLSVVDERLTLICNSLWKYQNLCPHKMNSLPRLLTQNCVTGCTVLINRALAELVTPFPQGVIMHDWWMALIAVSEGVLYDMHATTVKYRQHSNNDTGAKRWGPKFFLEAMKQGCVQQRLSLLRTRMQAEALIHANVLRVENKNVVEKYISMYSANWFIRRFMMFRMGFLMCGVLRIIAMFLLL